MQELQGAQLAPSLQQQQQQQRTWEQLQGVWEHFQHITLSSSSSSSSRTAAAGPVLDEAAVAAGAAEASSVQQQQRRAPGPQRSLREFRPSEHEKHSASKHAAKMSGWHAAGVTLLCLLSMAVLGFMGWKAMQWYERAKRPGYVELQALDTAFFRPTFTL
jgi:hypothetical protein